MGPLMDEVLAHNPQCAPLIIDKVIQSMDKILPTHILTLWHFALNHDNDGEVVGKMMDRLLERGDLGSAELWKAISHVVPITNKGGASRKAVEKALTMEGDIPEFFLEDALDNTIALIIVEGNQNREEIFETLNSILDAAGKTWAEYALRSTLGISWYYRRNNTEDKRRRLTRAINLMVNHGADIEAPTQLVLEEEDIELSLASVLHLACLMYEEGQGPDAPLDSSVVNALLDCGADWKRVLEHRHAPQGISRAAIERHPSYRREELNKIGSGRRQARSSSRPGM